MGDGGFLMTGNEIINAVTRRLPILFIVSNNNSYGSIRIHQDREYAGRAGFHVGTTLANPDFVQLAKAFGIAAERITQARDIHKTIARGLASRVPYLIEVVSRSIRRARTPREGAENGIER